MKSNMDESSEEMEPIYYSGGTEEQGSAIRLHPVSVEEDAHFIPSE